MVGWVTLALLAGVVFIVQVLPYVRMPDLSNTPWHELARGVAPGDQGAHQPDSPYFILGANDPLPSAVTALKQRLASQGWRVKKDPAPRGGITFVRASDSGTGLSFASYPSQTLHDLEDYPVPTDRLREWQQRYVHIYILEMLFT
jgi:hypothetical protein